MKASEKHMLHGLTAVHANLTAIYGTSFLILDCFAVIKILRTEVFFKDVVFSSTSSLSLLVFNM